MRNRLFEATMALAAVVLLAPASAAGQSLAAQAPAHTLPRTSDGQPDVHGFWANRAPRMTTLSIEGRSEGGAAEHLLLTGLKADHISVIVDPPDGKVPYRPWAAAKRQEIQDNYKNPKPEHVDPMARCFLVGVPRMNYQSQFQILQPPGYVVIAYEFGHTYRSIPLDGRPHLPEDMKLFMGDSRGHWEGNTLVVDVTNNNDQTWFDIVGTVHSDALHTVEHWTFIDADTIHYEATFDDPKAFTRPWTMAFSFARNKEQGYELMEMACHEGERSVDLMLHRGGK